jgi:putative addiction module CopG family antidote
MSLLPAMKVSLTKERETLGKENVRSGRYVDESDVVCDALRALEERGDFESVALEAALLEGTRSPHRAYAPATLAGVRKAA